VPRRDHLGDLDLPTGRAEHRPGEKRLLRNRHRIVRIEQDGNLGKVNRARRSASYEGNAFAWISGWPRARHDSSSNADVCRSRGTAPARNREKSC
jgi:hypothetical protein